MNYTCEPIMFVYNYCNNWTSCVGMVLSHCVPCIITFSSPIAVARLILFIMAVMWVLSDVLIYSAQSITITKIPHSHSNDITIDRMLG